MTQSLHVVLAGFGPSMLFIHGSAADHATWTMQRNHPALISAFRVITYDRRGTGLSAASTPVHTVAEHARDALALLDAHPSARPLIVGSSFGAVVALEAVRSATRPLAGCVLIEPPLAAADATPAVPLTFAAEFTRLRQQDGGPAAAAYFLRTVLGEAAFARIPRLFLARSLEMADAIAADSVALANYAPRYAALAACATPFLLVGGGRSAAYFADTLAALAAHLPHAQRVTLPTAGHMLHAEAAKEFNAALLAFAHACQPT